MNYLSLKRIPILSILFLILYNCSNNDSIDELLDPININLGEKEVQIIFHENYGVHEHNYSGKKTDGFIEGFESINKEMYSSASINLSSGNWTI